MWLSSANTAGDRLDPDDCEPMAGQKLTLLPGICADIDDAGHLPQKEILIEFEQAPDATARPGEAYDSPEHLRHHNLSGIPQIPVPQRPLSAP